MNLEAQFKENLEAIRNQKTKDVWARGANTLFNASLALLKKEDESISPSILLEDILDLQLLYENQKKETCHQETTLLREYLLSLPGFDENKSILEQPTVVLAHQRWVADMLVHLPDVLIHRAESLFNAIVPLFKTGNEPILPSLLLVRGLDLRFLYSYLKNTDNSVTTGLLREYLLSLPGFDENKSISQLPTTVFDRHREIASLLVNILYYKNE